MRNLKKTGLCALFLLIAGCGTKINVEYPVFPNTKEGRQLQNFVGTRRTVAMVVEKPKQGLWSQIFSDSSFIDQMPAKVFAEFDKEGYYKLIDVSKKADLMNEIGNSLTGLTSKRLDLGKQLAAEMFLYIGYQKPATSCGQQMKVSAIGTALALYEAYNDNTYINSDPLRMTAYRDMMIPLDATLIITETGQVMKAVSTKVHREFASVGTLRCPEPLKAYSKALDVAAGDILKRLSPKLKTAKIRLTTRDEDPDVADLLEEGYQEASGETPSMDRALEYWKKAEKKSRGKSEGALGNIGAYYFSIGEFDKAIQYFEKAKDLRGKNREYYREMRKKVEAAARVADEKEDGQ